jgi:hypothetical protein
MNTVLRRLPLGTLRRPLNSAVASTASTASTARFFSTNLNEDNMSQYRKEANGVSIPSQEWTNYHGKIPVLKTASSAPSAAVLEAELYGDQPRVSLLMELKDRVGVLHDVLKYFWKYDINVSRIESRPVLQQSSNSSWKSAGGSKNKPTFDFYMDFDGSLEDPKVQRLMHDLDPLTDKLLVLDEKDVHWFPRHVSELDLIVHRTLDAGVDLESDHPGFHDETYRTRRAELAKNANQHRWDQPIPRIEYKPDETATWGAVWDRMEDLWKKYACKEYMVRPIVDEKVGGLQLI